MLKRLGGLSHTTVIAYLALFLAIGGGAFAIAGGHKISGKKLKKRSTPANRLKKHQITGKEVNLAKLGKVPTAANADVAGALSNVTFVPVKKVNSSATGATFDAAEAAAAEVPLYDDSHFRLYGKCFIDTSPTPDELHAEWLIASKQNGAIFAGDNEELGGGPPGGYLNVASPETGRSVFDDSVQLGDTNVGSPYHWGFGALAADGYQIRGHSWEVAKFGALPAGDGLYGPGDVCLFTGDVQVIPG